MYSVTVRDSIMIAHSLDDPSFGPARNLHGATFVVDVEFHKGSLNEQNVVVDIVAARDVLRRALEPLDYQNLDELDAFAGQLTTAEFIARHIHDAVAKNAATFFEGNITVRLKETHDAWVSYSG